jgi:phosphoribosylformylglycinamidine synthase
MYKIKVFITLKDGILDPAGVAAKSALHKLGFPCITNVQIGKLIEITAERSDDIEEKVRDMCQKLLVNTVMEEYHYDIEEIS